MRIISPSIGLIPCNAISLSLHQQAYNFSPTVIAWNNPTVRADLEKYIIGENLKTASQLGLAFVNEMGRLVRSCSSEEEIYSGLRDFFERNHGVKAIFSSDRKSRLNRRSTQVKELLEGRNVTSFLDVGCGSGEITNELMGSLDLEPQNVKGLEVVLKEDINCPYPFEIIAFDGNNFPNMNQSFDLVTVFSVLHHANDPIKLIGEISKVQSENGYVVVRDCDAGTYESQLFNLMADYLWYKVYTPCPEVPITGNYFSSREWAQIFRNEGFLVENITFPEPGNPYRPFMMLLSKQKT